MYALTLLLCMLSGPSTIDKLSTQWSIQKNVVCKSVIIVVYEVVLRINRQLYQHFESTTSLSGDSKNLLKQKYWCYVIAYCYLYQRDRRCGYRIVIGRDIMNYLFFCMLKSSSVERLPSWTTSVRKSLCMWIHYVRLIQHDINIESIKPK